MIKKNPKKFILRHSEAKLKLYNEYLKRYLRILALSPYTAQINIYDLFCGTGIYADGKRGSPILAFDSIKTTSEYINNIRKQIPPIKLIVNDGVIDNVNKVKTYLSKLNENKYCEIEYYEYESKEMFDFVTNRLSKLSKNEKNLIFIDPYGYKEIHKDSLLNIMKNGNCEIILFLPISHMFRFKGKAMKEFENPNYEKLSNFINDFFEFGHDIYSNEKITISDLIHYIKQALTFSNEFYSTSFYLQRGKTNYNSLFFITYHLYGLEQIINLKWELDIENGQGFKQDQTGFLFPGYSFNSFREKLKTFLSIDKTKTNIDIYMFTILQEHPVKHANQILDQLQREDKLEVIDEYTFKRVRKGAFYINYDNFKNKEHVVKFILKY